MHPQSPIVSIAELRQRITESQHGVHLIKPKLVFRQVEERFSQPVEMNLHIPSSDIGSLTMLEAAILTSLIRLSTPHRLFEFGTFLGYSTALMAANSPADATVYSVDLGLPTSELEFANGYSENELKSNHISNDNYLRFVQSKIGPYYLRTLTDSVKQKIQLIKGDSTKTDVMSLGLAASVQFVFIDGGHQFEIIKSDTQKAHEMIGGDGVIVWHDYNSKIHSEVTDYMQEYSKKAMVFHVENTMIALCAVGSAFSKLFD
jgi:predicted O-methyltransferase YrrM